MSCLFNSFDPYFKQPFGAVRAGQTVRLSLCIPEELGYVDPHLVLKKEGKFDVPVYYRMNFDGQTPRQNHFSVEVPLNDPGLYFYYFDLYTDFRRIVRGPDNCGVISWQDGESWQITVYEQDFETPESIKGKVFYQIFPDRFCEGVENKPMPFADRIYQADKHAEPFWQPNEVGGHLNEDYFGGDLKGIQLKLPYLHEMGIDFIYLNPIFEAHSNHRYNTADYLNVDPLLGTNEDFETLCAEAKRYGIGIVLDGVFSHTGSDSRYFNRYGTYPDTGAYQSPDSPYRDWYEFSEWPDRYASWWGIPILPKLNHKHDVCRSFFTGVDGVGARYIRRGIAGWRLDVADELSDDFLDEFHASVRAAGAESARKPVIIGEVWENAAEKTAYGRRRRYLQGGQLDSVMNYPVRSGILAFVCDRDAEMLYDVLTELYASYPRPVSDSLMNLIGTHDTERILTVLGSEPGDYDRSNRALSVARLSPEKRRAAAHLLKLASLLQYTVFGIPSLYYGDEVGLEGYHDPFCRMPFPWDELEEPVRADLLAHYRALGALRAHPALNRGGFLPVGHGADWLPFRRSAEHGYAGSGNAGDLLIAVSRSSEPVNLDVPQGAALLLAVGGVSLASGCLTLSPDSGCAVRLG